MRKIHIDTTLSVGHILTTISLLMGGAAVYYGMRLDIANVSADVRIVAQRIEKVEVALIQLTDITVAAARQDEIVKSLYRRVEKLETRQ